MPQYAVIGSHPPDNCPIANKAVREFLMGIAPKWPELEKELNVKSLSWLHLDPNHKSFQLFEAPNAEAVGTSSTGADKRTMWSWTSTW